MIVDDMGVGIHLTVHDAIYISECLVCLLSTQQIAQQTQTFGGRFNAEAYSGILQIGGYWRTILYD